MIGIVLSWVFIAVVLMVFTFLVAKGLCRGATKTAITISIPAWVLIVLTLSAVIHNVLTR